MPKVPPTIEFDDARAMRYSPAWRLELLRIVEKPADEETVIVTKFAGSETFVGSYVEVEDPGNDEDVVLYGYSYERFMDTHIPPEDLEDGWHGPDTRHAYPTEPVDAYQADIEGELLTGSSGTQHVNVGDWIFRNRDGIWCTSTENFSRFVDLDSARPISQES